MNLSSGYLFAKGIKPEAVPPPPYPVYWWRSPGVCPVRPVNNWLPFLFWPSNASPDVHGANIDVSNKYYDGGDPGCDAYEITDLMPWGYDYNEHDNEWYWLRNFIPLYDSQGRESEQYRIVLEFGCAIMRPYVDENDPGYYWTTAQMRLTDRINQQNILYEFCDFEGVWKPSGNHVYMFAGADTFYWIDDWEAEQPSKSMHNIIYHGNIIDARHWTGYSRMKWGGAVFDLNWIEQSLGVHLDPRWV